MARYGYHWTPCDGGGGGAAAVAVVVVVAVVASAAKPVAHAAETALEIAVITVGAILGAVVLGGAVAAAVWVHRWRLRNRAAIAAHAPVAQALSESRRAAIEARRVIPGVALSDREEVRRDR